MVRRWIHSVCGPLLLSTTLGFGADPPPKPSARPTAPPPKTIPVSPMPPAAMVQAPKPHQAPDALKVPAGAVLIICKEVKDALNLLPDGVVLSRQRYQELMESFEQLERLTKPSKPQAPSTCKLSGMVDLEAVRIQAQFEFRTTRPKETVLLGCQRAWPRPGPTLDGQLPLLISTEEGLVVRVDTAGIHHLTLELEASLGSKGAKGTDQGFDFGLPQAAITTLEQLTFSRPVPEVRLNGRLFRPRQIDPQHSQLENVPLGAADRLDVAWKGQAAQPQKGTTLLEAVGKIAVRIDEVRATIEAELNLQVLRGDTRQWRIQLPPQTIPEVKEPRLQDDRIEAIDLPDHNNPILNIRLREPSSDPLRVVLSYRKPWRGAGSANDGAATGLLPVGPFSVLDTIRYRGTIQIHSPPDIRLRYHFHGDIAQRDVADEPAHENTVAAFAYWNPPTPASVGVPVPAPLELEIEPIKGAIESRVEHSLVLIKNAWYLRTKVNVKPIHTRVASLEFQVPAGYTYDREVGPVPSDLVESVDFKDVPNAGQIAQIKLTREQAQSFDLTLPAFYPNSANTQQVSLALPRPLQTFDRGGQVTVSLPEGLELVGTSPDLESPLPGERQHTWRYDRAPGTITLAWKPHHAEVQVQSLVDLTIAGRQAFVRHRLQFEFDQSRPGEIPLEIPNSLKGRIQVVRGGPLIEKGNATSISSLPKEHALEMAYSFPLSQLRADNPRPGGEQGKPAEPIDGSLVHITMPLVRPLQVTHLETKLRVWTDPGFIPSLTRGSWDEQPTESVADRDSLPSLVLRSSRLDPTLDLTLTNASSISLPDVLIENALIQVRVDENGLQGYRARFLISRLGTRNLDLTFPGPLGRLNAQVILGGKRITQIEQLAGADADNKFSTARCYVDPDLYHKETTLQINYQLSSANSNWTDAVRIRLQPPRVHGEVFLGRVLWQVELPSRWISLYDGQGYISDQRWTWRGGLLTPQPVPSAADLDRWLVMHVPNAVEDRPTALDQGQTVIVFSRAALDPVPLIRVPQQIWLLGCSLVVLALGLGLSFLPLSRLYMWLITTVLALGAATVAVLWPSLVPPIIYGCEPGAAVLVLILTVMWMLQRRYQRQVVFLPGFTRLKTGSSLIQRSIVGRPRGEPSTVDAPLAKRDSSAKQPV